MHIFQQVQFSITEAMLLLWVPGVFLPYCGILCHWCQLQAQAIRVTKKTSLDQENRKPRIVSGTHGIEQTGVPTNASTR